MNDKNFHVLRPGAGIAEKTIDSKTIFKGRILKLRVDEVELPDKKRSAREVVEHSGAVAIVPVLDNGNILFVKQYRYPISDFLLELPAGKLDRADERLEDCARRELLEETGYCCETLEKAVEFYTTPGFCDEQIHLFIARGLKPGKSDGCDYDEFISIIDYPLEVAMKMILENKIFDAKTMLGILYYSAADKSNIISTANSSKLKIR